MALFVLNKVVSLPSLSFSVNLVVAYLVRNFCIMGNDIRSQKGCWTCRVRKRKCDEKAPICVTCKALKLECHGYGEQPSWMDRGARQKAQATKIKQMVAEARNQRRRNHISSENTPSLKEPRRNSHSYSHSRDSSISSASTAPITPTTSEKPFWEHDSFLLPIEGNFQSDGTENCFAPFDDVTISDFLITGPTFSKSQASLDGNDLFQSDSFTLDDALVSPHNVQLPTKSISRPGVTTPLQHISGSGQSGQPTKKDCTVVRNGSVLAIEKVEDAAYLAYYFEKVFNWQFPFCESHLPAFNQGQIMFLISKSQPLYHATLALSSSYKSLQQNLVNDEHTPQYDFAIKELQNELRDPKAYGEVTLLACIVMFLHSAVRQTLSSACLWLLSNIF